MSNDAKPNYQWHKQRIPLIYVPLKSCKNQGNVKIRTSRIKNNDHEVAHKPAEIINHHKPNRKLWDIQIISTEHNITITRQVLLAISYSYSHVTDNPLSYVMYNS
jgi:hypothetical protein